jgi:hypothetical protein
MRKDLFPGSLTSLLPESCSLQFHGLRLLVLCLLVPESDRAVHIGFHLNKPVTHQWMARKTELAACATNVTILKVTSH